MSQLKHQQARRLVMAIIKNLLKEIDPTQAVGKNLRLERGKLIVAQESVAYDFEHGRLFLIGVGKASMPMCQAVLDCLGDKVYAGVGISKQPASDWPTENSQIKFYRGNHPVPGQDSILATTAVLDMLSQTRSEDIVLCCISGGTSALLTQPIISLDDWQTLNQALLASGCTIKEFNTIRRQLDAVKGGGLAHFADPAATHSLILSDVVGDDPAIIGSGPTVFSDETAQDAISILERFELEAALDTAVWQRIIAALQTRENIQPRQPNTNNIIGSVSIAASAAKTQAETLDLQAKILTTHLEGEAREAGKFVAAVAKDLTVGECAILGGETTVTLKGDGVGGRNLEIALAAAIALEEWPETAVATFATDGDDGPTGAAGAIVTGKCVFDGRELNMNASEYLNNNDSYTYFKTLDDAGYGPHLIITGQTGNNVNDLIIIMHN